MCKVRAKECVVEQMNSTKKKPSTLLKPDQERNNTVRGVTKESSS
jgi:hypothetical protein